MKILISFTSTSTDHDQTKPAKKSISENRVKSEAFHKCLYGGKTGGNS